MSAPQIAAPGDDLGSVITPPSSIQQVGPAEPYPRNLAPVTKIHPSNNHIISRDESSGSPDAAGETNEKTPRRAGLDESTPAPRVVAVRRVTTITPTRRTSAPAGEPPTARSEESARPAPTASPGRISGFTARLSHIARNLLGLSERGTGNEHVPGVAVVLLGVLALAVATAAFTLSFQMILPVVTAAGWTPPVSYLGPVVIDIAAVAAAFMGVLSAHPAFSRTGRQLLVMATFLSIILNLAGHQVLASSESGKQSTVPEGWAWTVELFSIMVPVILAISIHVFGTAFSIWLLQRRRNKEKEARRRRSMKSKSTSQSISPAPDTTWQGSLPATSSPAPAHSEPVVRETTARSSGDTVLDEIVRYALEHGLGSRDAHRAFAGRYSNVPSERTVERGISKARPKDKAKAAAAS